MYGRVISLPHSGKNYAIIENRKGRDGMKNLQELRKEHGMGNVIESFTKTDISKVLVPHIATGIPELDGLLGGGLTAGVIMLGGHSAMGKSTLALQIAENISAQKIPVFFYSMEMSKVRITAKALSRQIYKQTEGEVSVMANDLLYSGSVEGFSKKVWEEINTAREIVKERCENLMIFENREAISGLKIYKDVMEYAPKGKAVVIVDYLQVLGTRLDKSEETGARFLDARSMIDINIRYLRRLAYEREIPVVIINSLNRGSYGKPVSVSAFKESGMIEYSADVVLALQFGVFSDNGEVKNGEKIADQEKSKTPRTVDLIALKQRYGNSGEEAKVRFYYYAQNDYFRSISNLTPIPVPGKKNKKKDTENKTAITLPADPDPDYDTSWLELFS